MNKPIIGALFAGALCLLLAGCGWRSVDSFEESGTDVGAENNGANNGDTDMGDPDAANNGTNNGANNGTNNGANNGALAVTATVLASGTATMADSATTDAVTATGTVLVHVVSFATMGNAAAPNIDGFILDDQQVFGNRRQMVLMHKNGGHDGPLVLNFGQNQEAVFWIVVDIANAADDPVVQQTATIGPSSATMGQLPLEPFESELGAAVGLFMIASAGVDPTPGDGLQRTGLECAAGACVAAVFGEGVHTSVGATWGTDATWLGTAAELRAAE